MALGSKKMKVGWFWEKNPITFLLILAAIVAAIFYSGILVGDQEDTVISESAPSTEVQVNE